MLFSRITNRHSKRLSSRAEFRAGEGGTERSRGMTRFLKLAALSKSVRVAVTAAISLAAVLSAQALDLSVPYLRGNLPYFDANGLAGYGAIVGHIEVRGEEGNGIDGFDGHRQSGLGPNPESLAAGTAANVIFLNSIKQSSFELKSCGVGTNASRYQPAITKVGFGEKPLLSGDGRLWIAIHKGHYEKLPVMRS